MHLLRRFRFSLATTMMFVLATAAASALYAKVLQHTSKIVEPGWKFDVPTLFLLAIVLTALALGSWKAHSSVQIMLQFSLACLGCLTLIWIAEAQYARALRYWFQGCFAAMVTLPLLAQDCEVSLAPRTKTQLVEEDLRGHFLRFLERRPDIRRRRHSSVYHLVRRRPRWTSLSPVRRPRK